MSIAQDSVRVNNSALDNNLSLSKEIIKHKETALYYQSIQEFDNAIKELSIALNKTNDVERRLELLNILSGCYFLQLDFDKAQEVLEEFTQSELNGIQNFNVLTAKIFTQSGAYYYSDQLRKLESFLINSLSETNSVEAHTYNDQITEYLNSNLLWNKGEFKKGIAHFERHIKNDEVLHLTENVYYRYIGDIFNIRKSYSKALDFYLKIPAKDEDLITKGFTYYSRMIEIHLKLNNYEEAESYLKKLNRFHNPGSNPFKDIYHKYLNIICRYHNDVDTSIKQSQSLVSEAKNKNLKFFENYFAINFAEKCQKFGQNTQAEFFLQKIDGKSQDLVTLQKAFELQTNLGIQTTSFQDQNLEVFNSTSGEIDKMVDSVYPIYKEDKTKPWLLGLLLLSALCIGFIMYRSRNNDVLHESETQKLLEEYDSLRSQFVNLEEKSSTLNEDFEDRLENINSKNVEKLKRVQEQYELKINTINELLEEQIELKSKISESQEKQRGELSQRYNQVKQELSTIKDEKEKIAEEIFKYESLLEEKEKQLSQVKSSLVNENNDKLIRLSQYKDQLIALQKELKGLEKRTSGNLNSELKSLINQLNHKVKYENYLVDFIDQFELVNARFASELNKSYKLTVKQRVIAYSVQNDMSLKDVANLMGTSTEATKKARNRLWKQLNFSSFEDLKTYFKSIE